MGAVDHGAAKGNHYGKERQKGKKIIGAKPSRVH
jgi:hypothetical protein